MSRGGRPEGEGREAHANVIGMCFLFFLPFVIYVIIS
jgi:hypothetical protein